jgi:hypothetical protein
MFSVVFRRVLGHIRRRPVAFVALLFALGGGAMVAPASAKLPSNDNFRNATLIGSLPFSTSEDPSGARAGGEPQPACQGSGATVWWQFTPASSSTLFADTIESTSNNGQSVLLDTVLAVYTRTGNQFTEVACDDDSGGNFTSALSFSATSGTTYYFQVGTCCGPTFTWRGVSTPELDFSLHQ